MKKMEFKTTTGVRDKDLANMEALHDFILEHVHESPAKNKILENSKETIKRMYAIRSEQIATGTFDTKSNKNILEEANEIIFKRSEEKERDYGPIDDSFEDAATIASIISGKRITAEDAYKVLIGLKMARMKRKYKRDTYLDSAGYIGALAAYLERDKEQLEQLNINYNEEASE